MTMNDSFAQRIQIPTLGRAVLINRHNSIGLAEQPPSNIAVAARSTIALRFMLAPK